MCSVTSRTFTPVSGPCLLGSAMMPPCRESSKRAVDSRSVSYFAGPVRSAGSRCKLGPARATAWSLSMCLLANQGRMSDETLVRFTAHELRREDLRALMVRSNGPALGRALWHGGVLVITGTLLWSSRATLWVVPLLLVHGYVLAFLFCAFHETAHRTAFRSRWLNALVGSVAGFWIDPKEDMFVVFMIQDPKQGRILRPLLKDM